MLLPARVKHRKLHRGRRTGVATQGADLAFGELGLQASEAAWMTNRQIEAARRVMTRFVRRGGKVFIRVFPDKSVTKKPAETRMGSGKGAPEGWVVVIKPGRVLFEMGGVTPEMAKRAFQLAAYNLPMKTRTHGIKSGAKAAADVKIKATAAMKPGEVGEGIAGDGAALPLRRRHDGRTGSDRARHAQNADRHRHQRQDGQDGDRPRADPQGALQVQEAHSAIDQVQGARRAEPVQGRRPGSDHGDPAAVARQALAGRGHRGEGEIAVVMVQQESRL